MIRRVHAIPVPGHEETIIGNTILRYHTASMDTAFAPEHQDRYNEVYKKHARKLCISNRKTGRRRWNLAVLRVLILQPNWAFFEKNVLTPEAEVSMRHLANESVIQSLRDARRFFCGQLNQRLSSIDVSLIEDLRKTVADYPTDYLQSFVKMPLRNRALYEINHHGPNLPFDKA